MRTIKLRKPQFDDLLYPACMTGPVENFDQLEVAMRLMAKLQDPALTEKEVISEDLLREYAKARQKPVPQQQLREQEATFTFEEDEFKLLVSKVKEHIHRVNMVAAPDLYKLIKQLEAAEINSHGVNSDAEKKE